MSFCLVFKGKKERGDKLPASLYSRRTGGRGGRRGGGGDSEAQPIFLDKYRRKEAIPRKQNSPRYIKKPFALARTSLPPSPFLSSSRHHKRLPTSHSDPRGITRDAHVTSTSLHATDLSVSSFSFTKLRSAFYRFCLLVTFIRTSNMFFSSSFS